jgi:plastocyanin
MPHAPFVHRWRILVAGCLLAAAVASPVLAQGPRTPVIYVLMGDHYFLPASLTVQPGTTVVWINQSPTVHSVRSALWDSGPMLPGQAFFRSFDVPGEYWFVDPQYAEIGMAGYITVQAGVPVATRTPLPTPRPSPTPTRPPSPTPTRPPASPTPTATPRAEAPADIGRLPVEAPAALAPAEPVAEATGLDAPAEPALPAEEGAVLPLLGRLQVAGTGPRS